MNKYQIIISEKATQMLVSHASFLAQVSYDAAQNFIIQFETTVNSLESMPERCPWFRGEYIPKNTYRFIVFGKYYMLLYQVKDSTVYGDYIIDTRQDYQWLLEKTKLSRGLNK